MADDTSQFDSQFQGEVKGLSIGTGNVIYNYFYSHQSQATTEEVAETDNLPCPYRGLFHFGPNDAEFFFGREDFIEELYTLCGDVEIRHRFLDALIADLPGTVVMTMRADFLGNALSYRPFADVLNDQDYLLGPMNREELTDVTAQSAVTEDSLIQISHCVSASRT